MTPEQLNSLLETNAIRLVIKLLLLLFIFLYGIFAAVVLRQIQLMNRVVTEVGFSPILFSVALFHFFAVIVLFVLTLLLV